MEKIGTIYDGESVKVYATDRSDEVIFRYTDSITAYKKIKKAEIANKGKYCCAIADMCYRVLEAEGVKTHYLSRLSETEILCRKAEVIPVEVIVRNVIAGSMARRLGVHEGIRPSNTIFDLCYRHEELYDPLINDHHAVALGLATYEELAAVYAMADRANTVLSAMLKKAGIDLIDFKINFGKLSDGTLVIADEITPDSSRLWDSVTKEKLDKDRFRRDMGRLRDTYREVYERISKVFQEYDGK